ncbi:MAG: ABC transporter ATP-binding protein [Firmicutes bacterium]|nr:ABC transporter ATP-binding protein [Bacillota bacterium]
MGKQYMETKNGYGQVGGKEEDVLIVRNMKKYFPTKTKGSFVKAVDDISFSVRFGEVIGLVGESGSGKSTTAYVVMGMHNLTAGSVFFRGQDISMPVSKRSLSLKRDLKIVFQDPGTSLNPQRNIGNILSLPLKVHKIVPQNEVFEHAGKLLQMVGLTPETIYKYPRSLGGGERQLVAIARALATNPTMMVLDEPTSSLDVSIQAKIINTLIDLQKQFDMSYLFITHDMSLMRNIADRIAIMYLGRIVEMSPTKDFFLNPQHPYTKMLLSSIPVVLDAEKALKPEKIESRGEIPSPVNIPAGCRFNSRCPYAYDLCRSSEPIMREFLPDHEVACHLC